MRPGSPWSHATHAGAREERAPACYLEAVSFYRNHADRTRKKQVYSNGYVYAEAHIQIGPIGFLFDTRPYLREQTVRKSS